MKYNVVIKERETEEVVETISCGNYRNAENVLRGVSINLNHNDYFVDIEEV